MLIVPTKKKGSCALGHWPCEAIGISLLALLPKWRRKDVERIFMYVLLDHQI